MSSFTPLAAAAFSSSSVRSWVACSRRAARKAGGVVFAINGWSRKAGSSNRRRECDSCTARVVMIMVFFSTIRSKLSWSISRVGAWASRRDPGGGDVIRAVATPEIGNHGKRALRGDLDQLTKKWHRKSPVRFDSVDAGALQHRDHIRLPGSR